MYSRVCSQWQVRQEAQTDFVGLCHVLESRGLLSIKKAKETRLTKVSMFSMAITGVDVYYAHHTCNLYCLMHMIDTLPSLSLFSQVTLKLQEADVDRVLKDTPLLSSVLRTQI